MLYFALAIALAWMVFKMIDTVPMISKPLQLVGLLVVIHFMIKNRESVWPYVQKIKDFIPTPTPTQTPSPTTTTTTSTPTPSPSLPTTIPTMSPMPSNTTKL